MIQHETSLHDPLNESNPTKNSLNIIQLSESLEKEDKDFTISHNKHGWFIPTSKQSPSKSHETLMAVLEELKEILQSDSHQDNEDDIKIDPLPRNTPYNMGSKKITDHEVMRVFKDHDIEYERLTLYVFRFLTYNHKSYNYAIPKGKIWEDGVTGKAKKMNLQELGAFLSQA